MDENTAILTAAEKAEVKRLLLSFIRKVCDQEIKLYSDVETLPGIVAVLMKFFDPRESGEEKSPRQ